MSFFSVFSNKRSLQGWDVQKKSKLETGESLTVFRSDNRFVVSGVFLLVWLFGGLETPFNSIARLFLSCCTADPRVWKERRRSSFAEFDMTKAWTHSFDKWASVSDRSGQFGNDEKPPYGQWSRL